MRNWFFTDEEMDLLEFIDLAISKEIPKENSFSMHSRCSTSECLDPKDLTSMIRRLLDIPIEKMRAWSGCITRT